MTPIQGSTGMSSWPPTEWSAMTCAGAALPRWRSSGHRAGVDRFEEIVPANDQPPSARRTDRGSADHRRQTIIHTPMHQITEAIAFGLATPQYSYRQVEDLQRHQDGATTTRGRCASPPGVPCAEQVRGHPRQHDENGRAEADREAGEIQRRHGGPGIDRDRRPARAGTRFPAGGREHQHHHQPAQASMEASVRS